MLIHIDPNCNHAVNIDGVAHIVLAIDGDGKASLRGFFNNMHDSTYMAVPDEQLLLLEVPKLLAELRHQIQGLSGSTVTE